MSDQIKTTVATIEAALNAQAGMSGILWTEEDRQRMRWAIDALGGSVMEVTAAMVDAALDSWLSPFRLWRDDKSLAAGLRIDMRDAIDAALDAAPSGHGERG